MAARTSSQSGNWSDTATWGGSAAPGDGDTASIGAHTVTVDVNTTVGTSPNDATTAAITKTSATGGLTVAAGVTLTVKGNFLGVFNSQITLSAGASWTFDASGSGGSPVYCLNANNNFINVTCNGTALAPCTIQAVSGKTCSLAGNPVVSASYTTFRRVSSYQIKVSADSSWTHCTFDTIDRLNIDPNSKVLTITDCVWTGSTNGTDCLHIVTNPAADGSLIARCVFDTAVTLFSNGFTVKQNYFGGLWVMNSGVVLAACYGNFFGNSVSVTTNNQKFESSIRRNFFYAPDGANPHYCQMRSNATDIEISQAVFECGGTFSVDTGDCVFPFDAGSTKAVTVANCIAIPFSKSGETNVAGDLITMFSDATATTRATRVWRNTSHGPNASGYAFIDAAEGASNQNAGEVAEIKGNLVSGGTSNLFFQRNAGTIAALVPAAGVASNWYYNGPAGDNGLGFDDRLTNLDLWTGGAANGGNAAAQGITHTGTTDPQFYDSTRNTRTWAIARSYGTTTAEALTALQADPRRVADLIDYVFEGFKVQAVGLRVAAHDGATIGAANYHKSTRSRANITALTTYLTAKYAT